MSKFPTVGRRKHGWKHWLPVDMNVTSQERPFVPSVGGIRLLCNV